MIERALAKRDEIESFVMRCEREKEPYKRVPPEDHLSTEDWRILGEIAAILRAIYMATIRLWYAQVRRPDALHANLVTRVLYLALAQPDSNTHFTPSIIVSHGLAPLS